MKTDGHREPLASWNHRSISARATPRSESVEHQAEVSHVAADIGDHVLRDTHRCGWRRQDGLCDGALDRSSECEAARGRSSTT